MLKDSKKGLSTVVTTLIIILLVFVAIGIVWVVVQNVLTQGSSQIDVGAKCITSSVQATYVDCSTPTSCSVTLKRTTGDDAIGGVKLVFYNGTNAGNVIDPAVGNIATLSAPTVTVDATQGLPAGSNTPHKVTVAIYFRDDSGEERICSTSSSFNF